MQNITSIDQFLLRTLPTGTWRIAWLGDVTFHYQTRLYTQSTISVTLEAIGRGASSPMLVDTVIPVGELSGIAIDSIWTDGKKVSPYDAAAVSIEEIKIDAASAVAVKAGASDNGTVTGNYWLPFSVHPYHRAHTDSWCMRSMYGSAIILIPMLELIRFYFGSSSNLLKRTLCGIFSPERLWTAEQFDAATGHLKLTLAQGISGMSASDIGRIALDPRAREAASLVSKSLTTAIAGGARGYPRTLFPFTGKSDLKVIGRWLKVDGMQDRFVVSQILGCTHRFPFSKLEYVSQSRSNPGAAAAGRSMEDGDRSGIGIAKRRPSKTLTAEEPKKQVVARTSAWVSEVRFPDLVRKSILRVTPERSDVIVVRSLPAPESAGTADGSLNQKGTQYDLGVIQGVQYHEKMPLVSPNPSWQPYFDFLVFLSTQDWLESLTFIPLDGRQVKPHYSYLPVFADEDGVLIGSSTSPQIEFEAQTFRSRRVSVATVDTVSGKLVLISFEPASPYPDSVFLFYAVSVIAGFHSSSDNIHQIIGTLLRRGERSVSGDVHEMQGDAGNQQTVADRLHTYFAN